MKIAVLSGKGGTGKTLLSVNLAAVAGTTTYVDCDVEEPNGHLFFRPEQVRTEPVTIKIPEVDQELCDGCRVCVDFCQYNALAYIGDRLMIFEEVCHSCGGCVLFCPLKALSERDKVIGEIRRGNSAEVAVCSGFLNIGVASGIPIVKGLLRDIPAGTTFIDCPPGSACIVMESIKDADYCIFVAEPTLFGVHNLNMVHQLVQLFGKPHGAVLNKCLPGENPSEEFCRHKGIPILGRIPFDAELATINSDGLIAARMHEGWKLIFQELLQKVLEEVRRETASNSQR